VRLGTCVNRKIIDSRSFAHVVIEINSLRRIDLLYCHRILPGLLNLIGLFRGYFLFKKSFGQVTINLVSSILRFAGPLFNLVERSLLF
jgi:hypothetical protein